MKIVICGISGFVGKALERFFLEEGKTVQGLSIRPDTPVESIVPVLEGADAVINLAGASIVGRWNRRYKKVLRQSRLDTTEKIAEAIALCASPPHTLLNASAVGIYDSYRQHDETSRHFAEDFLADLVRSWERAAMLAQSAETRVCMMRFGVVYGHGGGAMEKMLPPFRWGLGGKTGDGFQMVSWIHLEDLVRGCAFLIERRDLCGVVNFTSPEPITNWEQAKTIGRVLRRPLFFSLPGWVLKLVFGEGASVLLDSKEVYPKVLQESGFEFSYPTFEEAMEEIARARG
jgi:uncharacterized protein (TIGR01777 family)